MHHTRSLAAKLCIPLVMKSAAQPLCRVLLKNLIAPIGRELCEGGNEVMNKRLLDLIDEAEDQGLLDVFAL